MGYQETMEAAGATVHLFQLFGSYQGTWLAKVTYEGQAGWIEGGYGSCSGCDAFQAEFEYSSHRHDDDEYFYPVRDNLKEGCKLCEEYRTKFIEFGKSYLISLVPHEQLVGIYENKCTGEYAWDDDKEILAFLKNNE